jgi:apolipoprotein D and lipocalin family protein
LLWTLLVGTCCAAPLRAQEGLTDPRPPRPVPVDRVELDRYVGVWYEIAKIPNRFQKGCAHGTTAEYQMRDDGKITVINRCYESDGKINEVEGVAKIVDSDSRARLEVSFVRFLGRNWFWGDYWIIGLDPDYRWAVVGHPERKYGWILAREPKISPALHEEIEALLRAQGYDPQRFEPTNQAEPSGN